jgi:flagellar basal-body rod modification protein FlgD
MNTSVNNTLATTLIGKNVLAEGDVITLPESGDAEFRLELGAEADVVVLVKDSEGNLVRRMTFGHNPAGDQVLEWDGENDDGHRVDPGQYELEVLASDAQGLPVPYSLKVPAKVDGVQFVDGTGFLMVGDQSLPLASVVEIYDDPSS